MKKSILAIAVACLSCISTYAAAGDHFNYGYTEPAYDTVVAVIDVGKVTDNVTAMATDGSADKDRTAAPCMATCKTGDKDMIVNYFQVDTVDRITKTVTAGGSESVMTDTPDKIPVAV